MKAKGLILILVVVVLFVGPAAGAAGEVGLLEVQFPQSGLMVPGVTALETMTADLDVCVPNIHATRGR